MFKKKSYYCWYLSRFEWEERFRTYLVAFLIFSVAIGFVVGLLDLLANCDISRAVRIFITVSIFAGVMSTLAAGMAASEGY